MENLSNEDMQGKCKLHFSIENLKKIYIQIFFYIQRGKKWIHIILLEQNLNLEYKWECKSNLEDTDLRSILRND